LAFSNYECSLCKKHQDIPTKKYSIRLFLYIVPLWLSFYLYRCESREYKINSNTFQMPPNQLGLRVLFFIYSLIVGWSLFPLISTMIKSIKSNHVINWLNLMTHNKKQWTTLGKQGFPLHIYPEYCCVICHFCFCILHIKMLKY